MIHIIVLYVIPSVQNIVDVPMTIEELNAQANAVMCKYEDFDMLLSSAPSLITPDVVMDEERIDWYYKKETVEILSISTHPSPDI